MSTVNGHRERSERLEVRLTVQEKALIDQAVKTLGQDETTFVVSELILAAKRVLAHQERRMLNDHERETWERLNDGPARTLPGVVKLLSRPSPFRDQ